MKHMTKHIHTPTPEHSLQDLCFVQVWKQELQVLVCKLAVTQVQFRQALRMFQNQGQRLTGPHVQPGLTEVQLPTQGTTEGISIAWGRRPCDTLLH